MIDARWQRSCSTIRPPCAILRRSSIPPFGRESWPEFEAADASRAPAVVVEAIKLVEGGLAGLCDEVWLVTCDAPIQRGRLRDRGLGPDDANRRISAQRHLRDRMEPVATRRIDTSGSLADTRGQVVAAWQEIDR